MISSPIWGWKGSLRGVRENVIAHSRMGFVIGSLLNPGLDMLALVNLGGSKLTPVSFVQSEYSEDDEQVGASVSKSESSLARSLSMLPSGPLA